MPHDMMGDKQSSVESEKMLSMEKSWPAAWQLPGLEAAWDLCQLEAVLT